MNYGLSGTISPHVDSIDWDDSKSTESIQNGGPRLITFMIYLSNVIAGGRTVFPQLGLSIKPIQGSVLFWLNVHPDLRYDSRNLHLGCPTLYGNKWIANKWIKLCAQFETYPCLINNKSFQIHNRVDIT